MLLVGSASSCSMSPPLLIAVNFKLNAVQTEDTVLQVMSHFGHASSCIMSPQLLIAVRFHFPNAARPEVAIHQGYSPPLSSSPVLPRCNNCKFYSQTGIRCCCKVQLEKRPYGPGTHRVPGLNDHIQSVKLLTAKSPVSGSN